MLGAEPSQVLAPSRGCLSLFWEVGGCWEVQGRWAQHRQWRELGLTQAVANQWQGRDTKCLNSAKPRVLLFQLLCAPGWSLSTFSYFLSEDNFGLIFPNVASCLCRGQSLWGAPACPSWCLPGIEVPPKVTFSLFSLCLYCFCYHFFRPSSLRLILRCLGKLCTPRKLILNSPGEVSLAFNNLHLE